MKQKLRSCRSLSNKKRENVKTRLLGRVFYSIGGVSGIGGTAIS